MASFYGVSESIGRVREWKAERSIHKDICPSLRALDCKIPKNVWLIEDEDIVY